MAGSVEGAGFWLPSEFFDDFVMGKENLEKNHSADAESDSGFRFSNEFPYDFEIQSGEHFKEKRSVISTSPQSTLTNMWSFSGRSAGGSSNCSPNGVNSPPTTPPGEENDSVGDLIYRAAGQVEKLKLNGGSFKHAGLLDPPKNVERLYSAAHNPNPSVFHYLYLQEQMVTLQKQGSGVCYGEPQMYQMRSGKQKAVGGTGQHGWPIQPNPTRIGRLDPKTVLFGGSRGGDAVKRQCAGTGVFLPRRYGNINDGNAYHSDSRKRPGYSPVFSGERNVHVLDTNLNKINGFAPSRPEFQSKFINPEYVVDGSEECVDLAPPTKFTT
ncbi:hypothetical protein OROMI_006930 [Orobanche minor]